MEVIGHLIFETIKIAVLGSVYATITVLIFRAVGKNKLNSWFYKTGQQPTVLWFISGFIISAGLFLYMFSYWGDHGLGDSPKIPIGYNLVIENTNWDNDCYVKRKKSSDNYDIQIAKFKVNENILIGSFSKEFYNYQNSYFIFDLKKRKITEFKEKSEYNEYASKNNFPLSNELLGFKENYRNYWGKWRFWLLP